MPFLTLRHQVCKTTKLYYKACLFKDIDHPKHTPCEKLSQQDQMLLSESHDNREDNREDINDRVTNEMRIIVHEQVKGQSP